MMFINIVDLKEVIGSKALPMDVSLPNRDVHTMAEKSYCTAIIMSRGRRVSITLVGVIFVMTYESRGEDDVGS